MDNDFLSPTTQSSLDEYAANTRFLELQEELRSTLFTGVNSLAPSRHQSRASSDPLNGLMTSSTAQTLDLSSRLIPTKKLIIYLTNWITDCAPYLDKFDELQHFGVEALIIAQDSPALLYAILAFSARQIERKTGIYESHDSLELYQESIKRLAPELEAKDPNVLITTCILACLELMSMSPKDWRRHVQGCAALFESFNVHGFSGGVLQAVFWCYARMDLCGVIISSGAECPVLPLEKWVSVPLANSTSKEYTDEMIKHAFLQKSRLVPDMHANWAVYLCAKTCILVYKRTRHLELGKIDEDDTRSFAVKWEQIWDELQYWVENCPSEMLPIKATGTSHEQMFPEIFFAHWAAISGNQLYHTACIMLLDIKPANILLQPQMPHFSSIWHARRVCGISITNPHSGSRINAIQPLYIAGKMLSHRNEHLVIGRLIKNIEQTTAWGALWRLKDLERVWGYAPGEISSVV
jgi:hypothetical protein